jgi:hypothetical protein
MACQYAIRGIARLERRTRLLLRLGLHNTKLRVTVVCLVELAYPWYLAYRLRGREEVVRLYRLSFGLHCGLAHRLVDRRQVVRVFRLGPALLLMVCLIGAESAKSVAVAVYTASIASVSLVLLLLLRLRLVWVVRFRLELHVRSGLRRRSRFMILKSKSQEKPI